MNDRLRDGFGTETRRIDVLDHGAYADTIAAAIDAGYRHLDTSPQAGTEEVVAEGIRRSGIAANEVTVATKVPPRHLAHDDVARSAEGSRERLGADVLDLLYVSAPKGPYDPGGTLAAFDELVAEGVIRDVGVCHFTPEQLTEAVTRLEAPLAAHQVERHPLLHQRPLLALAHEHDHWLVAASPLIRGFVAEIREIRGVAAARGLTTAQVTLAWQHRDPRVATLPHTLDHAHLEENLAAREMALEDADAAAIDAIDREWRLHPWFGA